MPTNAEPTNAEPTDAAESTTQWKGGDMIRAKWQMDGASTLAEAADRLEAFAGELRKLHDDGWTLAETIDGDYGHLVDPQGDAGLPEEDLDV